MSDATTTIQELKAIASEFVQERNWRQFHGAKNLSMAIAVEAAELMELFMWAQDRAQAEQWCTEKKQPIQEEIADIFALILMFCDEYSIDLTQAFQKKMALNRKKYPVCKAKNNNQKYNEL